MRSAPASTGTCTNPHGAMHYQSLRHCVDDLERHEHLVRIKTEVDPHLEIAEIQRRLHEAAGPAVLFENVKGSPFPAVANLFGTIERGRFLFRKTLARMQRVVRWKADPSIAWKHPGTLVSLARAGITSLPRRVSRGPGLAGTTTISRLPQIKSWPDDGGPFVTLPQVFTEDPDRPGALGSNLGMYRIQLAGNSYAPDREVGLHYQIHRGIGVHHSRALERGDPLRVSVFVGGPPAHTLAAVLPLPEGLSELLFAGMLGGRRFRYARVDGHVVSTDADFSIVGTIDPQRTLPEGPFGDHLGYYSLQHEFPVMRVDNVYHRSDAIWPFTVVGRPPQEDTTFGKLIHEITAPMVPRELPGVHALHAVDETGVHPLLLALGSERYVPYQDRVPQELLTLANAVLGFGQCSLAKYLVIAAREDAPGLDIEDIAGFLGHVLERVDWSRDLHFQTRTTMDTLDYSGTGLNSGSKVVIAAAGDRKRELGTTRPTGLTLPDAYAGFDVAMPGVLVIEAPPFDRDGGGASDIAALLEALVPQQAALDAFPLLVLVDDAGFCAAKMRNFLWVTFTRSNPSHDIHGVGASIEHKHWGCTGPLLIDARIKPHHAPPLIEDPAVSSRVDALAAAGGPLHGLF